MKGGIASRLALMFSVLVLVAPITVGILVFYEARQALIKASTEQLAHTVETVEVRFLARLEAITEDVRFLAETPTVAGFVEVLAAGGAANRAAWRRQVETTFEVFLQNKSSYLEVSLIGLAAQGQELVRIDRRGGQVVPVPASALGQQGGEDFFKQALSLPRGTAYLSRISRGEAQPSRPPLEGMPVLHAAVPVYTNAGRVFGVLAITIDFRQALETVEALAKPGVSLYLATQDEEVLLPPATTPSEPPTRFDQATLEADPALLSFFQHIPYYNGAQRHHLVVGATSPRATILAAVRSVRNRSALITLLFVAGGIGLALIFASSLAGPLRQITQALAGFGKEGRLLDLPVRRRDEIGVLARAFDTMAQKIRTQMQELEDEASRQRIILETSAEGIVVTDARGQVEIFNRAATDIFGYTAEEVIGQPIGLLIPGTSSQGGTQGDGVGPLIANPWKTLGATDEVEGRHKDGSTFPLSLALSSFSLGGEQKYAGFLQDITARKEHEGALRQAMLSAEAANKAKSAFLANMSHEIRTPLTGIIGFASLLTKQVSDKHLKYVRLIERSGERLKATLNSVLNLAKLEANTLEMQLTVMDVAKEVQEVVQLFQSQAQQRGLGLTYMVRPEADGVRARLDRGALGSVLHNLIGNAIKFTEEGTVSVRVAADLGQERVLLQVQDTGIGIGPEFMAHLFDAFQQESTGLSRAHEGSGLGLSITKRLVELMDGEISAESEKNIGSIFTVSFPIEDFERPLQAGQGVRREGEPPANGQPRILLVEDNEHTQYLIESLLEDTFRVTVVSNAEEALLAAFLSEYDLVLVDINLGEGPNGADVLRELRAMPTYRYVPIIAVTAYALPGDRERFLEMGFTNYLSKPFSADELLHLTTSL